MKNVKAIHYRYLANADFFNVYKPAGTEAGGGGQTYIDFPVNDIPIARWEEFFDGVPDLRIEARAKGPRWTFPVLSVGLPACRPRQVATVYQRRPQSVCMGSQRLGTRRSNRIRAWHPDYGFPEPQDPSDRRQCPRGLAVYLARTYEDEVWAGWFVRDEGLRGRWPDEGAWHLLERMVGGRGGPDAGHIGFPHGRLLLNENSPGEPFCTRRVAAPILAGIPSPATNGEAGTPGRTERRSYRRRQRTEEEILDSLFGEDEESAERLPAARQKAVVIVRHRNTRAVRDLKELYKCCQIRGTDHLFAKRNGEVYTEAHHLAPLGNGGADDPRNVIVVGPAIHRMLHYADVSGVDLSRIEQQEDASATLDIAINGDPYTISWHRLHAEAVLGHARYEPA